MKRFLNDVQSAVAITAGLCGIVAGFANASFMMILVSIALIRVNAIACSVFKAQ